MRGLILPAVSYSILLTARIMHRELIGATINCLSCRIQDEKHIERKEALLGPSVYNETSYEPLFARSWQTTIAAKPLYRVASTFASHLYSHCPKYYEGRLAHQSFLTLPNITLYHINWPLILYARRKIPIHAGPWLYTTHQAPYLHGLSV